MPIHSLQWISPFVPGITKPRAWQSRKVEGARTLMMSQAPAVSPDCLLLDFFFFFFFFFFFIYCIGFAIHWHESAMGVHVVPILNLLPLPSPFHPSGSSQCTSPKHPVWCIKPGPAISFTCDDLHVSMPFSHITHPCPLPQSPKDCSIHLCLFCCLAYRVVITIFPNSIYVH